MIRGIIRGNSIDLDQGTGLREGQRVSVVVQPLPDEVCTVNECGEEATGSLDARIDRLLTGLSENRAALRDRPDDDALQARVGEQLVDLRRLQAEEARNMEQRYRDSLALPFEASARQLDRIDNLIKQHENSSQ